MVTSDPEAGALRNPVYGDGAMGAGRAQDGCNERGPVEERTTGSQWDTLSKSRSRVLFSRDGLLLFFFLKRESSQALSRLSARSAEEVPERDDVRNPQTLSSKGLYIRKSVGVFPWEIK